MPEQSGGGCSGIQRVRHPDSGTFRIRWRSLSTTRLRLRRRLPARTGAVQVGLGVAGAARVPALGAPALLAVSARQLTERTLGHLSGYRGARPVRVGNGAWNQHQHDVWGMILDAIDVQFRRGAAQIVPPVWEGLAGFVDAALQHWREPDQGIWEVRGEPKHFTASKVLCWVAAARGADLAEERGDDKRIITTVLAIADELTEDGLVLRYKVEGTDTGFEGKEGTFTICSFWLVTALAMIGETERAHALCQKLLSFAGPLGLYAEEIDTTAGEHLGNFPQAFTHLALIEAVSQLIEMEPKGGTAFVA